MVEPGLQGSSTYLRVAASLTALATLIHPCYPSRNLQILFPPTGYASLGKRPGVVNGVYMKARPSAPLTSLELLPTPIHLGRLELDATRGPSAKCFVSVLTEASFLLDPDLRLCPPLLTAVFPFMTRPYFQKATPKHQLPGVASQVSARRLV